MKADIQYTDNFIVTGNGEAKEWEKAGWLTLPVLGAPGVSYMTRAKCLWSQTGIYFLFDCEDNRITCTFTRDFQELYLEDVVEVFLWPFEEQRVYFEYEISPLGYELPLICPNHNGHFHGWLPFKYPEEDRKILSKTSVMGGEKAPGANISGWKAEFHIPYKLLKGLRNCPPEPGSSWRANLCRYDYDKNPKTQWSLSTEDMENKFHNIDNFSTFIFKK